MVICFYIKPNLFPAQNHLSRKKLKKKKKKFLNGKGRAVSVSGPPAALVSLLAPLAQLCSALYH